MKKQFYILALGATITQNYYSQFANSPTQNPTNQSTGGSVGIGVGNPNAKLDVFSTSTQLRLSNTGTIFNAINTNASGYLTFLPSNTTSSRIGFNTASPLVGFHSNMGDFIISDPIYTTRYIQITPFRSASGDIPSGSTIAGLTNSNSDGLSFASGPTDGAKIGAYANSSLGWKSMWETSNLSSGTPNLLLVKSVGNVGIGTGVTNPTSHLQMISGALGTTVGNTLNWVNFSGNAGTGNNDQLKIYHKRVANGSNWNTSEIKIQRSVDASNFNFISFRSTDVNWGNPAIVFGVDNTDHVTFTGDGKVQIGTMKMTGTHSDAKLSVDGKIVTKEVVVTINNWADYVFKGGYKLNSLDKVEEYIKTYNHLPNVPSEEDINNNGVSLAEMSKIQMEKIEELTLYVIELKKEIEKLKK